MGTEPAQGASRRRGLILAAAVVAVVVFLLVRPSSGARDEAFREEDPAGYEACRLFDRGLASGGDVSSDLLQQAAAVGLEAQTRSIRAAIDDRDGGRDGVPFFTAGFDPMRSACQGAGYAFQYD